MKMDFHKTDCYNAALICLEKGFEIALHPEAGSVLFIVLEGKGVITHGTQKTEVAPGKAVFVGPDEIRGIKCIERMKHIGIQSGC